MQDQVLRMPVMLEAIDGGSDVMKERGALEQLALRRAQAVDFLCRIEELEREPCHVLTVVRVRIDQRGKGEDRTPASRGQTPPVPLSPSFWKLGFRALRTPFGSRPIWRSGSQSASKIPPSTLPLG
jgi:hypothetical protein